MSRDGLWSLLFSIAIAVLMAAILFIREDAVPVWVLIVYPAVGALLANVASHKLAAIVPLCGPAVRIDPENFKDLPTWVIHGAMDSEVAIGESVKMVRALRNAGCDVRFTVHADLDHDTWTPTYHDPSLSPGCCHIKEHNRYGARKTWRINRLDSA